LDKNGNAWVTNANMGLPTHLYEFSAGGTPLSVGQGFSGGGLQASAVLAIDPAGNIWSTGSGGSFGLSEFNAGGAVSPSTGFTGGGLQYSSGIAIDNAGDIWVSNGDPFGSGGGSVSKFLNTGVPSSPPSGFRGGGIASTSAIALDGAGTPWITNAHGISHLAADGTPLSGSQGYANNTSAMIGASIAIDGSGNVWFPIPNYFPYSFPSVGAIGELVGAATPVVTPISAGLVNNTLASRP
jgi:hypothetical protein